jgi:hypothetical protein
MYLTDAGDYTFALLEFMDARPALRGAPVVIVGESWGGTRSPLMLYMLQHYAVAARPPTLDLPDIHARLPWLRERVQRHFDALGSEDPGKERSPESVAAQFGKTVLIQPNFFGPPQMQFQQDLLEADPDFAAYVANPNAYDPYDVRKPPEYELEVVDRARATMQHPERLSTMLGVPLESIAGLGAEDRRNGYRHFGGIDEAIVVADEAAMRRELGELDPGDVYWLPQGNACIGLVGGVGTANAFLDVLQRTQLFVTNARWDAIVYTEALPAIFELGGLEVELDTESPRGAARPGVIHLGFETKQTQVRFPTYEAGHQVTLSAFREFAEDVEAWLDETSRR